MLDKYFTYVGHLRESLGMPTYTFLKIQKQEKSLMTFMSMADKETYLEQITHKTDYQ